LKKHPRPNGRAVERLVIVIIIIIIIIIIAVFGKFLLATQHIMKAQKEILFGRYFHKFRLFYSNRK
jgi:flagellar basal body-associated protein FliL